MKKWLYLLLINILLFSCEKQEKQEKEQEQEETAIVLGFNSGYEAPFTDKPLYKSTDSIKFEMTFLTNVNITKSHINASVGDEKGVFEIVSHPMDTNRYVNVIKGYFKPLNKTGDFDLNIKLSNSKSEKLITKKVLILSELNVDNVLPELNRERIISVFPLHYEFCNYSASKIILSSEKVDLGVFNLNGTTNKCNVRRVFINGFNGETSLYYNQFDGEFEGIIVNHGNTTTYASLSLEKILGQLAPFYGQPIETSIRIPNTRIAKIKTSKALITIYDDGLLVRSHITPL